MTDYARRQRNLWRLVKRAGCQAMLVTDEVNVTYLTGFTGDSSYLLLTADKSIIISDFRYATQLKQECPELEAAVRNSSVPIDELVGKIIKRCRVSRVAMEADALTVAHAARLAERMPKVSWRPTQGLVESLREIKDASEIAVIRESVRVAEKAFGVIRAGLRPEQTEREVAYALENQIRLFGGSGCSFPPIVAVGPQAALPHATPGDRRIGDSPFVLIDWGAFYRGYASDLTRVLVTGKIPPKLERIYTIVLNAQRRAIAAIKPGVLLSEVDSAARNAIAKAGYGKNFGHGLGHGIGLQIHEAPRLAANQDRPLSAGMVVTVEPGIYLPNWGGVRIEDDVLVTRSGHEVLTSVPRAFAESVLD